MINNDLTINHIAFAVVDIKKSIEKYNILGYSLISKIYDDTMRHVRIAFIKNNDTVIELVSPIDNESPITEKLNQSKNTAIPYHVCYNVESLDDAIAKFINEKFILTQKPANAIAFDNRKVAFLFNADVGLIELLENKYVD